MKVMCNQCGRVLDLMASHSFAQDEGGQLETYYFCSEEHLNKFAFKKGLDLGKN